MDADLALLDATVEKTLLTYQNMVSNTENGFGRFTLHQAACRVLMDRSERELSGLVRVLMARVEFDISLYSGREGARIGLIAELASYMELQLYERYPHSLPRLRHTRELHEVWEAIKNHRWLA